MSPWVPRAFRSFVTKEWAIPKRTIPFSSLSLHKLFLALHALARIKAIPFF
jgi:hypothetical protein